MQFTKIIPTLLILFAFLSLGLGLAVPSTTDVTSHKLGKRDIACNPVPNTCHVFSLWYPQDLTDNLIVSFDPGCEVIDKKTKIPTHKFVALNTGRSAQVNFQIMGSWFPAIKYKGVWFAGQSWNALHCESGNGGDTGIYCIIDYPC